MYRVISLKQTRNIKNVTMKAAKKDCGRLGPLWRVVMNEYLYLGVKTKIAVDNHQIGTL